MSRRKPSMDEQPSGAPKWMTTFSDLMTLLLTFFILLYSISSLDAIKFKSVANALQSVLLGEGKVTIFENDKPPGDVPINEPNPIPNNNTDDMASEVKEMYDIVHRFIKEQGLEAEVALRTDRRGVIIDIQENILFESGKAELKKGSKDILDKIVLLIKQFPNEIIVEGHTDNVPIATRLFPSNWELSVTRATTVIRYFIEEKQIIAKRLSAAGYGEYRPNAPNDSPQNKALNRRVNILIVTTQGGE